MTIAIAGSNAIPNKDSTALRREGRRFLYLSVRVLNAALNRLLALSPEQSRLRGLLVTFLFVMALVIFSLITLFSNPLIFAGTEGGIQKFFEALILPHTLRNFSLLLLPYILSIFFASRYLADVFNQKDFSVARQFISEVALGGSDNKLVIHKGRIDEADLKESPIVNIGGPGELSVALDSAVLVERPDGRPRVISPTPGEDEDEEDGDEESNQADALSPMLKQARLTRPPQNKAVAKRSGGYQKTSKGRYKVILEGFERIRMDGDQVIDLRDQFTDAIEMSARTKDGIPITISDVRFLFHIFRGKGDVKRTPEQPNPFDKEAVTTLFYSKTHKVGTTAPSQVHGAKNPPTGSMITTQINGLIRRELGKFISTHDLGEFLASIASPELGAIQSQEKAIFNQKKEMVDDKLKLAAQPAPPPFTPRPSLSALVSEFTESFKKKAAERGVQAQWVGVGTWKMPEGVPSQVIPALHLEAWRITVENKQRGSDRAMLELKREAEGRKILQLVRSAPLAAHQQNLDDKRSKDTAMRVLLQAYREQLIEAITSLRKSKGLRVKPSIVAARHLLERRIGFVSSRPVPAHGNSAEKRLYETMLAKVGGVTDTMSLLEELEREHSPKASREKLLTQINRNWDRDMR